MKCKHCGHRIVEVSEEQQKEHDIGKYAHGSNKTSYVTYPKGACHRDCICRRPEPELVKGD